MNATRCPHCNRKLGNFMYADACPHCHEELKANTRVLAVPPENSRTPDAWPVRVLGRLLRFVES